MKKLVLALIILSSTAFASEPTPSDLLRMCFKNCQAFENPGYALRACVANCKQRYIDNIVEEGINKYCNTYEEDCDRDNDGDVWGGL